MKILNGNHLNWISLTTLGLFLIFLPLSLSIDFMQNDDWNRYYTVSKFLEGDFRLLEVTATTFYTQGFMGMAFAKLFTVSKLPVLTLLIGCLNFLIFARICNRFFNLNKTKSILVGLVLFFNPLHFYSLFGFMTEVYLVFFCLSAIYFYYAYIKNNKLAYILTANILWILGFFAKQWAIVFPAAYAGYLILHRKWKSAAIQLIILMLVLGYYFLLFPKTNEMAEQKSFEPRNYESVKYILTHGYVYFIYLTLFAIPFVWSLILRESQKLHRVTMVGLVVIAGVLSAFLKDLFNQTTYPWKNFPLYPNLFTDKGFFLNGIEGEAVSNIYSPVIYFLDEIGLFSFVLFGLVLLIRRKINGSLLNFEAGAILIGYFLIVGTPFVFDRYLLVLVPSVILFLIRLNTYKINIWLICGFLLLQTLISIDYGLEYINRQQLTWDHANKIYLEEGVPRDQIIASHAWNKYYKLNTDEAVYWFRYSRMLPNPNEKVAREFWSTGIFTRTNIDIVRIQNR